MFLCIFDNQKPEQSKREQTAVLEHILHIHPAGSGDNSLNGIVRGILASFGITPHIVLECGQTDTLLGMAADGLGVTLLSGRIASGDYKARLIPMKKTLCRDTLMIVPRVLMQKKAGLAICPPCGGVLRNLIFLTETEPASSGAVQTSPCCFNDAAIPSSSLESVISSAASFNS